jgi:alkanesulfonate monooxygenase SsuD/methylene tetrahydromethanopterin reductase-like flavin-dependent oxidoreductase (luciferase family)
MKFGIGPFTCLKPPWIEESDRSSVYERNIQIAEIAETAGYDSAWVAEHHFTEEGYLPTPLSFASALASRTRQLEIGTGIAIAPFYEPIRLAEQSAVAHLLAQHGGGRFSLGLGLGYRDVEYDGFGVDRSARVGHLLDVVKTCRQAWTPGPVDIDGHTVSYSGVDVTPEPGDDVSIHVGANVKPGIERAAEIADGFLAFTEIDKSIGEIEAKLEFLRRCLHENDRDPAEFDVYLLRKGSVHPDGPDAAWEDIRRGFTYARRKYLQYFSESSDTPFELSPDEIDDRISDLERSPPEWFHCGTPSQVVAELEAIGDCWESELHLVFQTHYPGMDHGTAKRMVELVGDEVIPELEAR